MKIPPHVRWPAVIIGALTLHVVVSLATVWMATTNPSYAVEEDYYHKALHWDDRRAQDRVNTKLAWQVAAAVVPPASVGGPATLELTLADHDGLPVDGAAVTVETFHNARADRILRATLTAAGDGRYTASIPMRRSGVWEFRITAVRGSDTFTHRETRYVSLTPEPRN